MRRSASAPTRAWSASSELRSTHCRSSTSSSCGRSSALRKHQSPSPLRASAACAALDRGLLPRAPGPAARAAAWRTAPPRRASGRARRQPPAASRRAMLAASLSSRRRIACRQLDDGAERRRFAVRQTLGLAHADTRRLARGDRARRRGAISLPLLRRPTTPLARAPPYARARQSSRKTSSRSRPTNGVRPRSRSASKRLCRRRSPVTA